VLTGAGLFAGRETGAVIDAAATTPTVVMIVTMTSVAPITARSFGSLGAKFCSA
jgi:hypothetical protein